MKLEVGMYVRTRYGDIGKLISTSICDVSPNQTDYWFDADVYVSFYGKGAMICGEHIEIEIIKASHNIIDLIEEGDYVNGFRIDYIENINANNNFILQRIFCEEYETDLYAKSFKSNEIKSIVTKEQFERMSYKVEE